jgi:hypothetical protein
LTSTPKPIRLAEDERPDWTKDQPRYQDLSDWTPPTDSMPYTENIRQAQESMDNYPSYTPINRRLDDLIARGIISHKFIVDAILGDLANE